MGVGVYTSNFNGSGGTFIVDGLVGGEDEYKKYVLENVPDDALSLEQWRTDIVDDPEADEDEYKDYLIELAEDEVEGFEAWQMDQDRALLEDIEGTIQNAARELGMTPEFLFSGQYQRADFDNEFVLSASGRLVDFGWRSWQHDIIVGVGGSSLTREWAGQAEAFAGEIIDNTGLAPSRFEKAYSALSEATQTYVRLRLMQDGHECSYRTSGYTTSVYKAPEEGFDAALEALKEEITKLSAAIPADYKDGILLADMSERAEIVKALTDGVNSETLFVVPLYDCENGNVDLYEVEHGSFHKVIDLPPAFAEAMEAAIADNAGSDDLLALPMSDDLLEAWKALQSAYPEIFIASAEEWLHAINGDPVITRENGDGDEFEANIILTTGTASFTP